MRCGAAIAALLALAAPALAMTAEEQAAACAKLGGARIGMTAEAVRKSCWGQPKRINETLTAAGKHEQWVYRGGYLYLTNGLVTSIQTSR